MAALAKVYSGTPALLGLLYPEKKLTDFGASGTKTENKEEVGMLTAGKAANPVDVRNAFDNIDVGLERRGKKIILPNDPTDMSPDAAIKILERLKAQDQTQVRVHEEVECFPLEGAWALMQALKNIYGWISPQPTPGFFGPTPPNMVGLEVAPGQFVQVVWGDMGLPGVEGHISTGATEKDGMPRFVIGGVVKQKFMAQVRAIAEETRRIAKDNSIYKGKSVRMATDDDGDVNWSQGLKFLDVSKVNEDELVHPDATMEQVEVNLFTPIEKTEMCRKYKIPLSRKILFEGPYGTGKTITAYVAAKKAVANGWTFIYLDRVAGIKDALLFAKQYAPAVVFAEDIDRIMDGERDSDTDDVLNTIDGVDTKGYEILTIFTTNEINKIHQAMLRPGRLDAVISVRAPDQKAAEKLIRVYARELLPDTTSITGAASELAGQIPAVIREAVERSKLYAVGRGARGKSLVITEQDLIRSTQGMKMHLDLLNKEAAPKTSAEKMLENLREALGVNILQEFESDSDLLESVSDKTYDVQRRVRKIQEKVCQ